MIRTAKLTIKPHEFLEIGLSLLEAAVQTYKLSLQGEEARERGALSLYASVEERMAKLRKSCGELAEAHPADAGKLAPIAALLAKVEGDAALPMDDVWVRQVQDFRQNLLPERAPEEQASFKVSTVKNRDGTSFEVGMDETQEDTGATNAARVIGKALVRELEEITFVATVMLACQERRAQSSPHVPLNPDDEIALEKAYLLLDRGIPLPRVRRPLYKDGNRKTQTHLSFADPGPGHLKVTVRDSSLLDGMIVHIEWIDRDNVDDKSLIEAYRLPPLRSAARVRLHVGSETPCSAFIGRPVFEGLPQGEGIDEARFELGLLKAAHTMASTCSAMFALGVIDCKVAMDGLSTSQAVRFMRAVAGNVVREPGVQMLSAAFNVNTPLRENREGKAAAPLKGQFEIAKAGVELAYDGGFDKIAWDGASNVQPSQPIIGQLSMPQLLELVHAAHEKGLECYISAGLLAAHMRYATYAGVGGVGIGMSLHHVDRPARKVGEIDPALVRKALRTRDAAAKHPIGQAAARLARLDWLYKEGSLRADLDELRQQLYQSLRNRMEAVEQERIHDPDLRASE